MQKEIKLNNQKVVYQVRKSQRARHINLTVKRNAQIVVTIPSYLNKYEETVENFICQKSHWILKRRAYFKNRPRIIPEPNRKDYLEYKELSRQIAEKKLAYFNTFYGFSFKKIFIRNQTTRWGSCSSQRNLNFNYRIIFLPEKWCDYVIVHELCHLKELNHSSRFWNLVAKTIPEHKEIRKKMRAL